MFAPRTRPVPSVGSTCPVGPARPSLLPTSAHDCREPRSSSEVSRSPALAPLRATASSPRHSHLPERPRWMPASRRARSRTTAARANRQAARERPPLRTPVRMLPPCRPKRWSPSTVPRLRRNLRRLRKRKKSNGIRSPWPIAPGASPASRFSGDASTEAAASALLESDVLRLTWQVSAHGFSRTRGSGHRQLVCSPLSLFRARDGEAAIVAPYGSSRSATPDAGAKKVPP